MVSKCCFLLFNFRTHPIVWWSLKLDGIAFIDVRFSIFVERITTINVSVFSVMRVGLLTHCVKPFNNKSSLMGFPFDLSR